MLEHDHEEIWLEWGRVGFVAIMLGMVWLRVIPPFHGIDLVAAAGPFIGGYPIYRSYGGLSRVEHRFGSRRRGGGIQI